MLSCKAIAFRFTGEKVATYEISPNRRRLFECAIKRRTGTQTVILIDNYPIRVTTSMFHQRSHYFTIYIRPCGQTKQQNGKFKITNFTCKSRRKAEKLLAIFRYINTVTLYQTKTASFVGDLLIVVSH